MSDINYFINPETKHKIKLYSTTHKKLYESGKYDKSIVPEFKINKIKHSDEEREKIKTIQIMANKIRYEKKNINYKESIKLALIEYNNIKHT